MGDLTILSVSAKKNYEDLKISNSELTEMNSKKKVLEKKIKVLENEYEILAYDKNLILKNRDLKGQDQGLKMSELKEAYTFMHQKLSDISSRQMAIQDEVETLTKQKNIVQQEIDAQRKKPVINYSEIVIEVDVHKNTDATFYVEYMTPKASWQPYYDLRSDGIGKPVKLESKALVSQTTGIEWKNIDLVLSTNDPYQNSKEPVINPWYLYYYNYPQAQYTQERTLPNFDYSGQKIKGEVIDASTGESLPFARLAFNEQASAVSDYNGNFEIIVPKDQNYLSTSFVGYQTVYTTVNSPYLKIFLYPNEVVFNDISEQEKTMDFKAEEYDESVRYEAIQSKEVQISAWKINTKNKKRDKRAYDSISAKDGDFGASVVSGEAYNVSTSVAQKDLRVEYTIQTKFTIPSDGMEQRVSIATHTLNADYSYQSIPKVDPSVYLTAQINGWEKHNLLNGETNIYFDGTYIGKTFIDANSLKDTLTFSLGNDQKIQIERIKSKEKNTKRIVGSRQKMDIQWDLKVKNNGGAAIPLIIKDQFPISNDNDIKVKTSEVLNAQVDEKTQIITWRIVLNTGESKTLQINYSVDYDKNKVLYVE
jgi:hypothetical protein